MDDSTFRRILDIWNFTELKISLNDHTQAHFDENREKYDLFLGGMFLLNIKSIKPAVEKRRISTG